MRLLVSAGEVSADRIGADLVREVLAQAPEASVVGLGGTAMRAAGVELLADTNSLGAVGLSAALRVTPALWHAFGRVRRFVGRQRPDAALLIGNDGFHIVLGRWLRARGVPTAVLFPPQVWVWGRLAPWIVGSYDIVFASFAEESRVYRGAGATVRFVGHYLADQLSPASEAERLALRAGFGLRADRAVVALLPGSRRAELALLLHQMIEAMALLRRTRGPVQAVLPVSDPAFHGLVDEAVRASGLPDVTVVAGRGREALAAADVALCASGTATLEAALLGTPTVVAYRVSRSTYAAIRAAFATGLLQPNAIALPNLVLGASVMPELRQHDCTPVRMATELGALLEDGSAQRSRLALVRAALGAERALPAVAAAMLDLARPPMAALAVSANRTAAT